MKVKTLIKTDFDWQLDVRTGPTQYKNKGNFFTSCIISWRNGTSFSLYSKYSNSELEASKTHLDIACKVKRIWD